jgi:hypothetical protein
MVTRQPTYLKNMYQIKMAKQMTVEDAEGPTNI